MQKEHVVPTKIKKAPRAWTPTNKPPPQPPVTAAIAAADLARTPPPVRLLSKSDVCALTGVSFPTLWLWMQAGTFPRSRVVGGKSKWLSTEIDAWLAALPTRRLKGDAPAPTDEAGSV
jgi:predicted DNA-binding transcriptional regulator AlpA